MTCSFCRTDNPEPNKFCGQCGVSLDPAIARLEGQIEHSVKGEIERTLGARLKDQKLVELETSLAVADRLSSWSKLFATFVGIPLAALAVALGFLGFHTYSDFSGLVRDARAKITPELEQAQKNADIAATKAKDTSKQVQELQTLATQTSQSFSAVSQRLAEVANLSSEVSQLKNRARDVQKQLTDASKVTEEVKGLTSKVGQIEQELSGIGRVTILTNRADGIRGLVTYLSGYGAQCSTLSTDELGKIPTTAPDIIVVAADTKDSWIRQPQTALKAIFANYKVVAMGYGGAQLFSILGLAIDSGHVAHFSGTPSPLIVENPALLKPASIASSDRVLQVSQTGGESVGVYDEGSPDIAGFEGIGRFQSSKDYWPIARQGNYVLWGLDASAEQMTDAGKRLLVNLLIDQRLHPPVPLSQARIKFDYIQPGLSADSLNAQFSSNRLHFQVLKPGRIIARLSWNPPDRELALILNGPGPSRSALARKDGVSPVEIAFDVTDGQISQGMEWQISVVSFRDLGNTIVNYKLELSFPTSVAGRE